MPPNAAAIPKPLDAPKHFGSVGNIVTDKAVGWVIFTLIDATHPAWSVADTV